MSIYISLKRQADIWVSIFLLIILIPVFIVISLLILLEDGHNPIYRQIRVGRSEKKFYLYKFRTMVVDAEYMGLKASVARDDPRITSFGKYLRLLSLDELPQFINVLKGDMSIIGPRPLIIPKYLELKTQLRQRHSVRPGVTGLAQCLGRRSIPWSKRLKYDDFYVKNLDWRLDLFIFCKTIATLFTFKSIYRI